MGEKDYGNAEQLYRRVYQAELRQEPDSRAVRLLLASIQRSEIRAGDLYQRQGATEEALVSYEKAEELAPKNPQVLNAIAVLSRSYKTGKRVTPSASCRQRYRNTLRRIYPARFKPASRRFVRPPDIARKASELNGTIDTVSIGDKSRPRTPTKYIAGP